MGDADSGIWVFALMSAGAGVVTFWADRHNRASGALSAWLALMGLSVAWGGVTTAIGTSQGSLMLSATLESSAILAGIEWGRRVALSAPGRWRKVTRALFLAAQILVLVFWGLRLGYALLFPDLAVSARPGMVPVSGVEFAVLAPLIGSVMVLGAIALVILLSVGIDRIERVRLRAFMIAAPLLLSGLFLQGPALPLLMSLGLLVFFAGSVRFMILQVARGARLRQFVAAEVAGLVQDDTALLEHRDRRQISIVACDLRGFTALAQQRSSDQVMALLERYYAQAGHIAARHGAAVKDHAGDGILMLVGAPVPVPDGAARALRLARALIDELHPQMQADAGGLGLGVGVATGEVSVGAVRGAGRLEYAAVGSAVNLAARLCAAAPGGEAWVDATTIEAAREAAVEARTPLMLKGYAEPVQPYALMPSPRT